ncbi:MAG TPA: vitamin K epoxide reductase family protein [Candidatus Nanopelagicales bacterium]|nr:vitamin K epoxide reductase family protein [Candidatus Nanopelagicales bacterium]
MPNGAPRWPAALAFIASLLGFAFGASSTFDYIKHLDRQVHDLHCSFIPGVTAAAGADTACRTAMYSPYSALFRDRYWGGVPISLFAVGAFAFLAAFSLYLLLAGRRAPRRAAQFLFIAGIAPLLVSALMLAISLARLGAICKTCAGIYVASALLAVAGIAALVHDRREARLAAFTPPAPFPAPSPQAAPPAPSAGEVAAVPPTVFDVPTQLPGRPRGSFALLPAWLLALGIFAVTPALLYVSALPNYTSYITGCGTLEKLEAPEGALLEVGTRGAVQPATLFVDPLCPTCKALHQRLVAEGIFDQLDAKLILFPLDNECNWMLDRPLHPGACMVSRAILCSDHRALAVLEWAYENQEQLLEGAKAGAGPANVQAMIRQRWPGLDTCMDSRQTRQRLDKMLRYVVDNKLPVSTPQVFLGETRLCDEDTDIGLAYAARRLAPALGGAK